MAATKIRKISSWTLLISSIINIIVLGMFYAGGAVDPAAEMKESIYTRLLANWTSVLFFVTIISTMLFTIWQFLTLLKTDTKSAIMSLVVLVCFVAALFIAYMMGDATPLTDLNVDSQVYNTPGWLEITDIWIMSTIVLLVPTVACVVRGSVKRIVGK